MYFAAAGVGTLGMVDSDIVDLSNLQRQVIHSTPDVGKPKLESAKEKIRALNPEVRFVGHETRLSSANALELIRGYDLVVDGTDNFPTRYLVNDACVILKKPNVYGSIYRFQGMASVFAPHLGGPCYRCWYPEPPPPGAVPSCAEAGVLGVICGIIGNIQATEAIKLIIGQGALLMGRLLRFDAMAMTFRELRIPRDPQCPVCGTHPTITALIDYQEFCGLGRGETTSDGGATMSPNNSTLGPDDVSVEQVKAMLNRGDDFVFVDVRNQDEREICAIPGTLLLPLPELADRYTEIPTNKLVVLHCHHGGRSKKAVQFLRSQGFTQVKNLAGGIDAWAEQADPKMARY
jgi:molybdopterin/thiamine biosynthesis adenylyltransferase/rhodanese-related sulfurtransferase